ncbi:iron chaperone [Gottfriedia sp. NPDC058432]|uniref:iron chaperone n=1 Tax=Gottfriedia sp. NPDC058432 TaxID=3346497 RepID=UPI00364BE865
MENTKKTFETIDEYISQFQPDVQEKLQALRKTVKEVVPNAVERISYQMPTFALNKNLVHFAAFKHHIGFYPGASGIAAFKQELSVYKGAKGSVQFPLNDPLPFDLIKKIVKYREVEDIKKAEEKLKKKK